MRVGDGWVSELWVRLRMGGENERGFGNNGNNGRGDLMDFFE